MIETFWKRFVASVTVYGNKYSYDPFFRTEVNTIALLVLFSTLILSVVGASSSVLYHDVTTAMSQAINESLVSGSPPSDIGAMVVEKLDELQVRNMTILSIIVVVVTIIAGYIVARIVLSPTRNALEFQKQFIGNIAHELRTPLSNIKTESEIALLDPSTTEEVRFVFKSTVEELNRISDIINNLLSLSASIRPERMEFHDEDLGSVVENSMRKLRELAERKELDITARMSERKHVWGNTTALEQIVTNILKNAIMYTKKGGHIAITVEPVYPDFMELRVRDSGIGIARKDLFRIFEPYFRTDQSRTRGKGGTGLGLAIVSELVKVHHGRITVRSIEGRGTTVTVLLPAGKKKPGVGDVATQDQDSASEIAVDFSHGSDRIRKNSS